MSYSESKHCYRELKTSRDGLGEWPTAPILSRPSLIDAAMDAALRSVPLPDGLLARLSMLVAVLPEEATDHADWLGC